MANTGSRRRRRSSRERDVYGSESQHTPRRERYATEASKEQLVNISSMSAPSSVAADEDATLTVGVRNDALVVLPGDPDRCSTTDVASGSQHVGYTVGLRVSIDGAEVAAPSGNTTCVGDPATETEFVITLPSLVPGRYTVTVEVVATGSERILETKDVSLRVLDTSDDSSSDDDTTDDGSTDDDTTDDGDQTDDDTTDDGDQTDDENTDGDGPPEGQTVGEWWGGLSSQERMMYGGLAAAGFIAFSQGVRG